MRGEMEFKTVVSCLFLFSIWGKGKMWGGRPVSANSGRMRKSRLCRLGEEERRASARRMFD